MNRVTHNRFQICCSKCGQVAYPEQTLELAIRQAGIYAVYHNTPDETITIYDLMAHRGSPEIYDSRGKVIQYRKPV